MLFYRLTSVFVLTSFLFSMVMPAQIVHAESLLALPVPGTMVNLSAAYAPVLIKGLKVHPENPLLFDFIIDTGHSGFKAKILS